MNIPISREQVYISTNIKSGNAGNGSNFNKPTIPKIDFNPTTEFIIGRYNNNIEPTQIGTLFTDNSNNKYNTNNPINGNNWINNKGLNATGSNKGSFYKPNVWSPYNLNDSQINGTNQNSQTFPYNANSQHIDGSIRHVWDSFMFNNINNSTNSLEQVTNQDNIYPQERQLQQNGVSQEYTDEEQLMINQLVDEMG
jgi:hypothetical protein